MVTDHGVSDHYRKKDVRVITKRLSLFSSIVFDMKLLAILQATEGKALIKK